MQLVERVSAPSWVWSIETIGELLAGDFVYFKKFFEIEGLAAETTKETIHTMMMMMMMMMMGTGTRTRPGRGFDSRHKGYQEKIIH